MKLATLEELNCTDNVVLVRGDLDVEIQNSTVANDNRLQLLLPTISTLYDRGASKVVLLGHRGRPKGTQAQELSLAGLCDYFKEHLVPATFINYRPLDEFSSAKDEIVRSGNRLVVLENLRFWPEEEAGSADFAEALAGLGECYVNEAFAASHRMHTSLTLASRFVGKNAAGLRLQAEVDHLSRVTHDPVRPLVFVISGVKKDKLTFLDYFKALADKVLLAGRLPEYLPEDYFDPKVLVARLNPDKEDVTIHSIEQFEQELSVAGTVVVSGPIGRFEESGHRLGTERVLSAIADSRAFKVAGGGDTEHALSTFNLTKRFDWVSVGGGAMLEFLAKGTLPGIEALLH